MIELCAWAIACLLVIITVIIHYEILSMVSDHVVPWAQHRFRGRRVIGISIATLMLGHIIEIWVFAFAMFGLLATNLFGSLTGEFDGSLSSYLYFSAVNYTSLGDNMIRPTGPIRAIAVSETLAGMMMIAWSASFAYLKMEQIWKSPRH